MLSKWTDKEIEALIKDWDSVEIISSNHEQEQESHPNEGSCSTSSIPTFKKLTPITIATPQLFHEIFGNYFRSNVNTHMDIKEDKMIALLNTKYFISLPREEKLIILYGIFPLFTQNDKLIQQIKKDDEAFDPIKTLPDRGISAIEYLITFKANKVLWKILSSNLINLEQTKIKVSKSLIFKDVNLPAKRSFKLLTLAEILLELCETLNSENKIEYDTNLPALSIQPTTTNNNELTKKEKKQRDKLAVLELKQNLAISIPLTLILKYFPDITISEDEFCKLMGKIQQDAFFKAALDFIDVNSKIASISNLSPTNIKGKEKELESPESQIIYSNLNDHEKRIFFMANLCDQELNKMEVFPNPLFKAFVHKFCDCIKIYQPDFLTKLIDEQDPKKEKFLKEDESLINNQVKISNFFVYLKYNLLTQLCLMTVCDTVNSTDSKNNLTALHTAVIEGKLLDVKYLLAYGANINAEDIYGKSPLIYAIESKHLEIALFLIHANAKVNYNYRDKDNFHPAAGVYRQGEFIESLKISGYFTIHRKKNTFLHLATIYNAIEVLKLLLKKYKLDVNAKNADGDTPLHLAAKYNLFEAVKILVKNHADVNALNKLGQTPIFLATENRNQHIFTFLHKSGTYLNTTDNKGTNLLHYASIFNAKTIMKILCLLDSQYFFITSEAPLCLKRDHNGKSAFIYALENQSFDIHKLLIEQFYDETMIIQIQEFFSLEDQINRLDEGIILKTKNKILTFLIESITPNQSIPKEYWQKLLEILCLKYLEHTSIGDTIRYIHLLVKNGANMNVLCNPHSMKLFTTIPYNFKRSYFVIQNLQVELEQNTLDEAFILLLYNKIFDYKNFPQTEKLLFEKAIENLIRKGANIYVLPKNLPILHPSISLELMNESPLNIIKRVLGSNSDLFQKVIKVNAQAHNSKALKFFSTIHSYYSYYLPIPYISSDLLFTVVTSLLCFNGVDRLASIIKIPNFLERQIINISIGLMAITGIYGFYCFWTDNKENSIKFDWNLFTLFSLIHFCGRVYFNNSPDVEFYNSMELFHILTTGVVALSLLYKVHETLLYGFEAICSHYCKKSNLISEDILLNNQEVRLDI